MFGCPLRCTSPEMSVDCRGVYKRQLAIVALIMGLLSGIGESRADSGNDVAFTIKDSIELSYIVDPTKSTMIEMRGAQPVGNPIYSPDGKYFVLVTQRGILATNALEGTIWLFDVSAVRHCVFEQWSAKPLPRKLATVSATSNTPVINDVRWVEGSKRIVFLGKNGSPYQRLFQVDIETGSVEATTNASLFVTAYDLHRDTIVYTSLIEPAHSSPDLDNQMIDVGQSNALELIYRHTPSIHDPEEGVLIRSPNALHMQSGGKDLQLDLTMADRADRPLRLFVPTLSLAPNRRWLVTVLPIYEVPKAWEQYSPPLLYDRFFRLKAGPVEEKNLMDIASYWRPEQYVLVDLEAGTVSPLVNAPAGRDLGYGDVPTEAFWLDDNRHVLLINTYLPLQMAASTRDDRGNRGPVAAIVDVVTGEVKASVALRKNPPHYGIRNVAWDTTNKVLTIRYEAAKGEIAPDTESYLVTVDPQVIFQATSRPQHGDSESGLYLSVDQDLNTPPMLWARLPNNTTAFLIWDPNPQLTHIRLGNAFIYRWQDREHRLWAGVLVLPPDYDKRRRYPLVIQTHGYDADKFFADGKYTTGSGGRALAAKGIIVLQIQDFHLHMYSPNESSDNVSGFQSAVDHLVLDYSVDPHRVGVIGFSRTSHYVIDALTRRPNLFAAAMSTNPIESYVWYIMNLGQPDLQGIAEEELGGVPTDGGLMKWFKSAPNFNLDKVRAPLLLTATEKGALIGEWETYSMLRRLNKPVDMLLWSKEDTPHILVQPTQRFASQQASVDWFDFWLNNRENADPAKVGQYARWRQLQKQQGAMATTPSVPD